MVSGKLKEDPNFHATDNRKGTIACILEQSSTTRRSAGIPAMMTGVLSARSQVPSYQEVMMHLLALASQPVALSDKDVTNLPQVHAINCLKEILKSSTLGKRSEDYLTDCLELAADNLKSEM